MRLTRGRMICPNCGENTTFTTVAHVAQDWEVDSKGHFIRVIDDCSEVVADPDTENIWTCKKCGAEAEYRDDNDP